LPKRDTEEDGKLQEALRKRIFAVAPPGKIDFDSLYELERRRRERWNTKRRKQTRDQYLAASLNKAQPWKPKV
jgi:hypothetical protein